MSDYCATQCNEELKCIAFNIAFSYSSLKGVKKNNLPLCYTYTELRKKKDMPDALACQKDWLPPPPVVELHPHHEIDGDMELKVTPFSR